MYFLVDLNYSIDHDFYTKQSRFDLGFFFNFLFINPEIEFLLIILVIVTNNNRAFLFEFNWTSLVIILLDGRIISATSSTMIDIISDKVTLQVMRNPENPPLFESVPCEEKSVECYVRICGHFRCDF